MDKNKEESDLVVLDVDLVELKEIKKKILEKNSKYNLVFNEEKHIYKITSNDVDIELPSVTTLISRYFPFRKKKIAQIVADKNWTTSNDVINYWSSLSDFGTYIHLIVEKYCNGEKLSLHDESMLDGLKKFFEDYNYFEIIAVELRLFSLKYHTAGTIDLLVKDKRNNRLITIDWKTSKKSISRKEVYGFGLKPFNYIESGKFFIYSLQVWGYNLILKEEYGIEIYDSLIVRLLPDSYEIIEPYCMLDDIEELFLLEKDKK